MAPQLLGGKIARHEVAPYVGPQLAEAIGIDAPAYSEGLQIYPASDGLMDRGR